MQHENQQVEVEPQVGGRSQGGRVGWYGQLWAAGAADGGGDRDDVLQVAEPGAAGGGDQPPGVLDVAGMGGRYQRDDGVAVGGQQQPAGRQQGGQFKFLGAGRVDVRATAGAGGWPAQY